MLWFDAPELWFDAPEGPGLLTTYRQVFAIPQNFRDLYKERKGQLHETLIKLMISNSQKEFVPLINQVFLHPVLKDRPRQMSVHTLVYMMNRWVSTTRRQSALWRESPSVEGLLKLVECQITLEAFEQMTRQNAGQLFLSALCGFDKRLEAIRLRRGIDQNLWEQPHASFEITAEGPEYSHKLRLLDTLSQKFYKAMLKVRAHTRYQLELLKSAGGLLVPPRHRPERLRHLSESSTTLELTKLGDNRKVDVESLLSYSFGVVPHDIVDVKNQVKNQYRATPRSVLLYHPEGRTTHLVNDIQQTTKQITQLVAEIQSISAGPPRSPQPEGQPQPPEGQPQSENTEAYLKTLLLSIGARSRGSINHANRPASTNDWAGLDKHLNFASRLLREITTTLLEHASSRQGLQGDDNPVLPKMKTLEQQVNKTINPLSIRLGAANCILTDDDCPVWRQVLHTLSLQDLPLPVPESCTQAFRLAQFIRKEAPFDLRGHIHLRRMGDWEREVLEGEGATFANDELRGLQITALDHFILHLKVGQNDGEAVDLVRVLQRSDKQIQIVSYKDYQDRLIRDHVNQKYLPG